VIVLLSLFGLGVRVTEPTPIGPTQLISPARTDQRALGVWKFVLRYTFFIWVERRREVRLHSLLRRDDAFSHPY
jgi:hypothetical protein